MGHKNPRGSVSVTNYKNRIRLRWRFQGKRYSLNFSLFNNLNLLEAKKQALQIEQDILLNCFDESLQKYGKEKKPVKVVAAAVRKIKSKSTVELFVSWAENYRHIDFDLNTHYAGVRGMMKRWGDFNKDQVVLKLKKEKIGKQTYNERLAILKHFSKWMVKQNLWSVNPLEDVTPQKKKKVDQPKRKPFTLDEINRILDAFKNNRFSAKFTKFDHAHYYPFIYFLFKTGVRNAEAVGLRVSHIHTDEKFIEIKEVLARTIKGTNPAARIRKETKNGKERRLPLSDDLIQVLEPLLINKSADDLVFTSHTGLALDDRMFQRRIFKPVLKQLSIPERVLYACRHTFGSRCIEAGMTPVMTAFLMGNNPETALRNYVHQISMPTELPKIM